VVSNHDFELLVDSADSTAFWLPLVIAAIVLFGAALLGAVFFKVVLQLSVFDPCLREKPQPLLSEDEIHVEYFLLSSSWARTKGGPF
jgi:hypothetical protein